MISFHVELFLNTALQMYMVQGASQLTLQVPVKLCLGPLDILRVYYYWKSKNKSSKQWRTKLYTILCYIIEKNFIMKSFGTNCNKPLWIGSKSCPHHIKILSQIMLKLDSNVFQFLHNLYCIILRKSCPYFPPKIQWLMSSLYVSKWMKILMQFALYMF